MAKYIQVHLSGKDFDYIDFSSMKKKDINWHYYIDRKGNIIFLKDTTKRNKHQNNDGIDILISGKDNFTTDTIFALKHLIYKLRLQGDLPLIINADNFDYIKNVFLIH